ncbi:MAG: hypothetical protein JXN64_05395 [Spirochaetes bacterium]|nr:hypothetical protein [Spirochaetota bacterium]
MVEWHIERIPKRVKQKSIRDSETITVISNDPENKMIRLKIRATVMKK